MAIFVLVHGAQGGGWQFRALCESLQASGHVVYRPTLTGLGERAHLLNRDINLDTHITDIVNVLEYEDLHDVVLVGKSYGGMVITGVAERVPERLRRVVYLDAVVPLDGQSLVDVLGPDVEQKMRKVVDERGDGSRLPANREGNPRMTDHPFATLTQRLTIQNPAAVALPHTYIRYRNDPANPHTAMTARMLERAKARGWDAHEIAAPYDLEQSDPDRLAQLLVELA
jgi:pimeloyl-ACP methyl ester carboxylesterase